MPRLNEIGGDSTPNNSAVLRELYLRNEPAIVITFTDDVDEIAVHYEPDDANRGILHCLGAECPYCLIGAKPQRYYLIPVYNVETRAVEVLRVSPYVGPGTLLSVLKNHMSRPDAGSSSLVIILDQKKYSGASRPLDARADRGFDAIARFKAEIETGLTLGSVVRRLTRSEIEAIPRIGIKLAALGLQSPVDTTKQNDDGTPF